MAFGILLMGLDPELQNDGGRLARHLEVVLQKQEERHYSQKMTKREK